MRAHQIEGSMASVFRGTSSDPESPPPEDIPAGEQEHHKGPPRQSPTAAEKAVTDETTLLSLQNRQITTLSPPVGQFIINTILQIAAFICAIAFGVFAVKSVTVGSESNSFATKALQQAVTANQLAILALCLSSGNQTADLAALCVGVTKNAVPLLPSAASALGFTASSATPSGVPPTSTPTVTHWNTTLTLGIPYSGTATALPVTNLPSSPKGLSSGTIKGISIGIPMVVLFLFVGLLFYYLHARRRRSRSSGALPQVINGASEVDLNTRISPSSYPLPDETEVSRPPIDTVRKRKREFRELFMDTRLVTETK